MRFAAGKSLGDVACELAMSQARLERIESGSDEIDLALIARFATSLGISVATLFTGL